MTLFLSGPMGSGKTTLARAYAKAKGVDAVDLDEVIEARYGASVSALFRERGEAAFRAIERATAREVAAAGHAVVALGGGTVTDRATRRKLLRDGVVVTLTAPLAVLAGRTGTDRSRPLLQGDDPEAALARIVDARRDAYAEAHATLDTSAMDEAALVTALAELEAAPPLVMPLGARTYPIHVGAGALDRLGAVVADVAPSSIVLVTDENARSIAARARDVLTVPSVEVVLPPGERHKTLASVDAIWSAALGARVDRRALVLAVGGGVVSDLAGFAAATLLRGVAFAAIPTTLLAMVDASVGGKTGFDRAEGKNLVGAFHQPRFVVCDPSVTATLSDRDLASGLAEVLKAAWLEGEADVAALEHDSDALRARDGDALARATRRAVATKIAIVSEDEHEQGVRAHLNLGHTLGHAIEAAGGYARTHGECVGLGMIAALRVGVALGDATPGHLARLTALLARLGLPTDLDAALDDPAVPTFLASDKKRAGGGVRFVVPGAPGHVRLQELDFGRVLTLARG